MSGWLIVNARVVNEGEIIEACVRIKRGRIERIAPGLSSRPGETRLDARGRYLLPGMIDTQVHFREPGLTDSGNHADESRAAVAGGVTSCFDLPDTRPPTTTRRALADKFSRAAGRSAANFSFYLGATLDNSDEIRALGPDEACAVHVATAASDPALEVDSTDALSAIFEHSPLLVVARAEDAELIETNRRAAAARLGEQAARAEIAAEIRSTDACLVAAERLVRLAEKAGAELHLANLSTAAELALFDDGPLAGKRLSAGVCLPHLYFMDADYAELGNLIKSHPAIKTGEDRQALRRALRAGQIDLIASDHAPWATRYKTGHQASAAAGMPMAQYALPAAWSLVAARALDPAGLVECIAHNPARRFGLAERGFIREGYRADLVLLDDNRRCGVDAQPMLSRCGWTPLAGRQLPASVAATWVNGHLVWRDGLLTGIMPGEKIAFDRP